MMQQNLQRLELLAKQEAQKQELLKQQQINNLHFFQPNINPINNMSANQSNISALLSSKLIQDAKAPSSSTGDGTINTEKPKKMYKKKPKEPQFDENGVLVVAESKPKSKPVMVKQTVINSDGTATEIEIEQPKLIKSKKIEKLGEDGLPIKKKSTKSIEYELDDDGNPKLDNEGNPIKLKVKYNKTKLEGGDLDEISETNNKKKKNLEYELNENGDPILDEEGNHILKQKIIKKKEKKVEYEIDDNGNQILDNEGNPIVKIASHKSKVRRKFETFEVGDDGELLLGSDGLPIPKVTMIKPIKSIIYELDENGNQILDDYGQPIVKKGGKGRKKDNGIIIIIIYLYDLFNYSFTYLHLFIIYFETLSI